MSDKNKNTDESEGDDEENVTSKGSSTDNKKTDPSQTLDLGVEFCAKPPSNAKRKLKIAKSKIGGAAKSYAEVGFWFGEVRKYALWRESLRPKYNSFAEFYRDMGYTADQVCHQIGISKVLTALIERVGNRDVKITVYHGTVLLAGTRNKDVRFEADTDLACEIFLTVLDTHNKVTGKLLREEMVKRNLVNPPQKKGSNPDGDASGSEDDDDQIDEPVDGMSLGEDDDVSAGQGDAGEEPTDGASAEGNDGSVAKAPVVAQEVRKELVQARIIASSLIDVAEKSEEYNVFRPQLIELRSLLEEIEKQLGN